MSHSPFIGLWTKESRLIYSFCFMTPLGIGIGWVISESASDLIQGIFLSISSGMFINLALTHILKEELGDGEHDHFHGIGDDNHNHSTSSFHPAFESLDISRTIDSINSSEEENDNHHHHHDHRHQEDSTEGMEEDLIKNEVGIVENHFQDSSSHSHPPDITFSEVIAKLACVWVGFAAMSLLVLGDSD